MMKRRRWFLKLVSASAVAPALGQGAHAAPDGVSVRSFGARGDGVSDDSAAFRQALKAGADVMVPASDKGYLLLANLVVPAGVRLFGDGAGRPRLIFQNVQGAAVQVLEGGSLNGLDLSVRDGRARPSTVVAMRANGGKLVDCAVSGGSNYNVEIRGGNCLVTGGEQTRSRGTAIALIGALATRVEVAGVRIKDNRFFGIWISEGARDNWVHDCSTTGNGLELIGVTVTSGGNRIENNHASKTGDNGISITGDHNEVSGNVCEQNAFSGIGVYGSFNHVHDNVCRDNGYYQRRAKATAAQYSGITVTPSFGGLASGNLIEGNVCEGGPGSPQQFGIRLGRSQYPIWTARGAPATRQHYVSYKGNLYKTAGGGSPGAHGDRPPVHTQGVESDGKLQWEWVGRQARTAAADDLPLDPQGNIVRNNRARGNRVGGLKNESRLDNAVTGNEAG